jgi:hypothetical protein
VWKEIVLVAVWRDATRRQSERSKSNASCSGRSARADSASGRRPTVGRRLAAPGRHTLVAIDPERLRGILARYDRIGRE